MSESVLVPPQRLERWLENFSGRHGHASLEIKNDRLCGLAVDGSTFEAALPFSRSYAGQAAVAAFADACSPPEDWGILLVRKGGFAVARMAGTVFVESKVGQRHVQGRTKAGGQSQQRFARRRDNQARAAYEAAADHAARMIPDADVLVVGGDRSAVEAVLADVRLATVRDRIRGSFLSVPDPRRSVLEDAVLDAQAVSLAIQNS